VENPILFCGWQLQELWINQAYMQHIYLYNVYGFNGRSCLVEPFALLEVHGSQQPDVLASRYTF
jgi:hypothetical protein